MFKIKHASADTWLALIDNYCEWVFEEDRAAVFDKGLDLYAALLSSRWEVQPKNLVQVPA